MINYETIKQLASENGITVNALCALSPKNDPFYTGRPSEVRAAEWFTDLFQRFQYGNGVHLRRIHYRIVSQETPVLRPDGNPYLNTQKDWDYLNEASKWARYLNLVSPGSFVDKRNPEAIIHAYWKKEGDWNYDDPTPDFEVQIDGDEEYVLPELPTLPGLPDELPQLPLYVVTGYVGLQQPYHLEIWCEKTTMNDVLQPLCRLYGCNLVTGAGEMSITSVVDFLRRVRQADRPARILYISDFDPAGLGMPISVARKIEYFQRNEGFSDLDIRLQPVVLTSAQVAEYSLPRVPVKDTDLRKASFEASHGEGQVELDALEALYPGHLRAIVLNRIMQYYDSTLQQRASEVQRQLSRRLMNYRNEVIGNYQEDLSQLQASYNRLLDLFSETQEEFNTLVADFQPKIDQYQVDLQAIKTRMADVYGDLAAELEDTEINLDDYPLPEPMLPAEPDDLLYDSTREYVDQLIVYKSYRNGGEE